MYMIHKIKREKQFLTSSKNKTNLPIYSYLRTINGQILDSETKAPFITPLLLWMPLRTVKHACI